MFLLFSKLHFAWNIGGGNDSVKSDQGKSQPAQATIDLNSFEAVTKDGNRNQRTAGDCLPPIAGGHKARRYEELETVRIPDSDRTL